METKHKYHKRLTDTEIIFCTWRNPIGPARCCIQGPTQKHNIQAPLYPEKSPYPDSELCRQQPSVLSSAETAEAELSRWAGTEDARHRTTCILYTQRKIDHATTKQKPRTPRQQSSQNGQDDVERPSL